LPAMSPQSAGNREIILGFRTMTVEIERKFLVATQQWRSLSERSSIIRQGYLSRNPERVVHVRQRDDHGYLTNKGTAGKIASDELRRSEFEYSIPVDDAVFMLDNLCVAPIIHKRRYELIAADGTRWEIDEFVEPEPGLVLAEVELNHSSDDFVRPDWLGAEVTHAQIYSNNNIGIPSDGWMRTSQDR
jgi:adenylate cyclase